MLRYLADHNFNERLLDALQVRCPGLDVRLCREEGLDAADDPLVLAWAAANHRAILTHDVNTMLAFASKRIKTGQPMAGIVEVDNDRPWSILIEDLLLVITCYESMDDLIVFVPLR
jgi:predicted nuclease of predicted toxin-antitoxin system